MFYGDDGSTQLISQLAIIKWNLHRIYCYFKFKSVLTNGYTDLKIAVNSVEGSSFPTLPQQQLLKLGRVIWVMGQKVNRFMDLAIDIIDYVYVVYNIYDLANIETPRANEHHVSSRIRNFTINLQIRWTTRL